LQIKKLIALLNRVRARYVILLCHHNSDPDAIGSAYAFSQLLHQLRPEIHVEIAAAQGPSKLSKHILRTLPIRLIATPYIEKADVLVLLDTNTTQQLADWQERVERSGKPIVVIDHHATHPETKRIADLCIADETASSTCEIVYSLFQESRVKLSKREALALFLGIAYDTKHFTIATSKTFKVIADLVETGIKAEEALALLSMPMETSERIARLKAARRLDLIKIGDWLIGTSNVSAYQASAARALLMLGIHVAIVGGEEGGKIRMSLRASRIFYDNTGIHLGKDIANPLGEYVHGMGGGHATSAGVNGEGDLELAFKKAVRILSGKLKK